MELHEKYDKKDLEILGFPCNQFKNQEPGTEAEIKKAWVEELGVQFQLFSLVKVNGNNTHPVYKYLKDEISGVASYDIEWNFAKFLINKEGKVVQRYAPSFVPLKVEPDIIACLENSPLPSHAWYRNHKLQTFLIMGDVLPKSVPPLVRTYLPHGLIFLVLLFVYWILRWLLSWPLSLFY